MTDMPGQSPPQGAATRVSDALVSYDRPPVTEVVVAVRFAALPLEVSSAFGHWWKSVAATTFPKMSAQPQYDPPIEDLGAPRANFPFSFDLSTAPSAARYWFVSADDTELLQLQPNWLACNWRKVAPQQKYSRWGPRRDAFAFWYRSLSEWCSSQGVELVPEQCEVSYINDIAPQQGLWTGHGDAPRLFAPLAELAEESGDRGHEGRVTYEDVNLRMRYRLPEIVGRLHVDLQSVHKLETDQPAFILNLTARGRPESLDESSVLRTLDYCRNEIVLAFSNLISDEAARAWGRTK